MKINHPLLLLFIFLAAGCGMRSTGSRINKYAETYYKGEGKLLIFVKPLQFENDKKQLMQADFTYNKGDSTIQTVAVNMSIYGTPPFSTADSVNLSFGGQTYTDTKVRLLYNENLKRKPFSRQALALPNELFDDLLNAENVTITLYYSTLPVAYHSGTQWKKSHTKLYQLIYW